MTIQATLFPELEPAVVPETVTKSNNGTLTFTKSFPKKAKPNIPDEEEFWEFHDFLTRLAEQKDICALLIKLGYDCIRINYSQYTPFGTGRLLLVERGHCGIPNNFLFRNELTLTNDSYHEFTLTLLYVAGNGNVTCIPVKFQLVSETDNDRHFMNVTEMSVGKIHAPGKCYKNAVCIQNENTILTILQEKRPWAAQWLHQSGCPIQQYLSAPWLETLDKAGFAFARTLFNYIHTKNKEVELVNRLCQDGTKPKDIFKCSKAVQNVLKLETNLTIWDTFRRLEKNGTITKDNIQYIYQQHFNTGEVESIRSILSRERNGKRIFSWTSLTNYLNRLDMYEAISSREAIPLLEDYLRMCQQLDMTHRVDGDSLKREHDIAARLCRERRNREMEEKMRKMAEEEQKQIAKGDTKLARATYRENIYFVRPITEYNDLLDEARQQHNCVASYADMIVKKQTRIFTMRETAHPEKSLITIELSPDCRQVKQKYLAYNQPIRNKSMSEFIDRWMKQLNAA